VRKKGILGKYAVVPANAQQNVHKVWKKGILGQQTSQLSVMTPIPKPQFTQPTSANTTKASHIRESHRRSYTSKKKRQ
jgi:hypothetical protein